MSLPDSAWVGIFAHPDDEWMAGWPVFQNPAVKKGVIFFVGNNCSGRGLGRSSWQPVLITLLKSLGVQYLGCLGYEPDFSRFPLKARLGMTHSLMKLLSKALTRDFEKAALITHNPSGEYGHPDHRLVFEIILDLSPVNESYITDLCIEGLLSEYHRRLYYQKASSM